VVTVLNKLTFQVHGGETGGNDFLIGPSVYRVGAPTAASLLVLVSPMAVDLDVAIVRSEQVPSQLIKRDLLTSAGH